VPTLNIEGRKVTVDDSFLKLSPDQQSATVDEIVASFGKSAPAATPAAAVPDPFMSSTGTEVSPALAAMGYGELAKTAGRTADNLVRAAANGMTFGMADRFAGGMDALTGKADSYAKGVDAQHAETLARRQEQPGAGVVGEVAGGLTGGAGLIKSGLSLASRVGPALFPRILGYGAEGAAYGAAHGAGNMYSEKPADYIEAAKHGATIGAATGVALPALGAAAGGAYRAASAFLGPQIEGTSRGASSLLRSAAMADEAGLRALPSMGPEAMLVDAGPAMLGLGQGAGTGTGAGRTALVDALRTRDNNTGARLANVVEENLGATPRVSRIEANLSGDRAFMGQEYQPLLQNAGPVDTRGLAAQLDAMAINERGGAQRAARQVREMLNDPVATRELDRNPAALLNSREAIDGLMKTEVDPNTIRLLTRARQAVDGELTRAVPGIKSVDAQIAEAHRQSAALQRGSQVLDTGKTAVRPADLVDEIRASALPQGEMVGPSAAPLRLRQGTREEIDRVVGTNVNDLNALEKKLGTPQDWNAQKMSTVFGEGPTQRVAEALMNNRRFRAAYQDIVQGSQSAQRLSSSAAMEGGKGGNIPHDTTLTGIGLKAVNMVAKAISGASSANTKEEVGRLLASEGPAVQRIAEELMRSAQTAASNSRAISGLVGNQRWIGAVSPAEGRGSTR
jgi:hypothetical protein